MEEYFNGQNYFIQNNNYNNPINYNQILEIKMKAKRNQGNSKYRAFNKNMNEEAKNIDFINNNNDIPKRNFNNFYHRKNIKSLNDKELYNNKDIANGGIFISQKNKQKMPITLEPNKNGFLPYSINSNINKIQNKNYLIINVALFMKMKHKKITVKIIIKIIKIIIKIIKIIIKIIKIVIKIIIKIQI